MLPNYPLIPPKKPKGIWKKYKISQTLKNPSIDKTEEKTNETDIQIEN